jgi:hypothetical protein
MLITMPWWPRWPVTQGQHNPDMDMSSDMLLAVRHEGSMVHVVIVASCCIVRVKTVFRVCFLCSYTDACLLRLPAAMSGACMFGIACTLRTPDRSLHRKRHCLLMALS